MTDNTIRVGVIGAGGNTKKFHIPGLQKQRGVEVVAVANRTLASAAKVADEFGIESARTDWEEIVYDDSIDAVCIGTWPYMHARSPSLRCKRANVLCGTHGDDFGASTRHAGSLADESQPDRPDRAGTLTFKVDRVMN